ncbi:MAG TPA: hypothetical protein VMQ76_08985 [Terracidiphilus sp.]|jgi:hypothetical protein|nr:hypothetical protein [Terracidiphilus sp.]
MKENRIWKNKIADALKKKGFSNRGANKTAKATMKLSIQSKERKESAHLHGKVKIIMKDGVWIKNTRMEQ